MDRLWAPWRLSYVTQSRAVVDGCVFCTAAAGEDDSATHVLVHGEACFAMLNRYPYNNGHMMILPYQHVSRLADLPAETLAEMMTTAAHWTAVMTEVMRCEGFNLGVNLGAAAGAGLEDHLHLHIVPRWRGDTNFMPVVGDVKVMPQELSQTWQQLRDGWRAHFAK